MTQAPPYDAMFSGLIGQDYDMLRELAPMSVTMSHLVGTTVEAFQHTQARPLSVLELGGGTGITTLAILLAAPDVSVTSVDNEPVMQEQAKRNLSQWHDQGRLHFTTHDALSALQLVSPCSVDVLASAYTLHNFPADYRNQTLTEIFRVLKPGGLFVNGDRYALDDMDVHTRTIQEEVSRYFRILTAANKLALLEHWIVHLFSDESANHIMREAEALAQLAATGFTRIQLSHRAEVNALVTAYKP